MSVYKPQNSTYWHYDFRRAGARFHGSTGCRTKREAVAYENRVRSEAALPRRERPPITVDEACGLYLDHLIAKDSTGSRHVMPVLIKAIGATRLLGDVTQRDLQVFVAKRRNGRRNSTVNREMNVVSAIWRHAERSRFDVGEMPNWKALRLKEVDRAPRELATSEEPALFGAIRDDLLPCLEFLFLSGWRRGEVLGLRWSDCDLGARVATTRIKGGDVVTRPLTSALLAIIANQPKVGPFVFTYICVKSRAKRRAGERYPMTATVLRLARTAWAKAGVDSFRIHDLRHTRATRIVRATGSLASAKEALKHRTIQTTLRYAHVLDEDVRNALEASESRNSAEVSETEHKKGRR